MAQELGKRMAWRLVSRLRGGELHSSDGGDVESGLDLESESGWNCEGSPPSAKDCSFSSLSLIAAGPRDRLFTLAAKYCSTRAALQRRMGFDEGTE